MSFYYVLEITNGRSVRATLTGDAAANPKLAEPSHRPPRVVGRAGEPGSAHADGVNRAATRQRRADT